MNPLRSFRLRPPRSPLNGARTYPKRTIPNFSSRSNSTSTASTVRATLSRKLPQWGFALRLAVYINLAVLTSQASIHTGLHILEEERHPTSEAWPQLARYYLRRARLRNAWNPWGEQQPEDAVHKYLLKTLSTLEKELATRPIERQTVPWRGEYLKLRKSLAEHHERVQEYDAARKEYETALAVPLPPGLFAEERVHCAGRYAKILEWYGDDALAQLALSKAVGFAYPPAIEDEKLGTVKLPPPMPSPEDRALNTPALVAAVSELAVFLARHGEQSMALAMLTQVLRARKEVELEVENPRKYNRSIGDPCMIAATRANIGELMFALGQKEEGVAWEEKAFEEAWGNVEYRLACKECCNVAAGNLVKMGELMRKEAEGEKVGWFGGSRRKEERVRTGEELKERWERRLVEVKAVRAVKDAEEAVGARA